MFWNPEGVMSKYDPLREHLMKQDRAHVPMSFEEIEALIATALPPSARKHRAWWSNNPSNSVITHAWLDAGYRSEAVNLEAARVVFRREKPHRDGGSVERKRHPIFGCMKGTLTVMPGVDLTEPAEPDWGRGLHDDDK